MKSHKSGTNQLDTGQVEAVTRVVDSFVHCFIDSKSKWINELILIVEV